MHGWAVMELFLFVLTILVHLIHEDVFSSWSRSIGIKFIRFSLLLRDMCGVKSLLRLMGG